MLVVLGRADSLGRVWWGRARGFVGEALFGVSCSPTGCQCCTTAFCGWAEAQRGSLGLAVRAKAGLD